jgi:hypothetical protein
MLGPTRGSTCDLRLLSFGSADAAADPADRVTLDDGVSFALLVVLETLTPAERTAWVLHDLFGLPFPEVAAAVGRTPVAVRQLAARARRHISAAAPRIDVDAAEHQALVTAFLAAASAGDLPGLLTVLCLAPSLMEALNPREDESHGSTEEVPGRASGASDPDGGRRAS